MKPYPTILNRLGTLAAVTTFVILLAATQSVQATFPNWMGNCCSHPNPVTTGTLYAGDSVTFTILMNQVIPV